MTETQQQQQQQAPVDTGPPKLDRSSVDFAEELDRYIEELIRTGKNPDTVAAELGFDLARVIQEFVREEPFFAYINMYIRKVATLRVPTIGVAFVKHEFIMLWNPVWVSTLESAKQVKFVLKHELYHLILLHVTTRLRAPHSLWNIATDLAINSILEEHTGIEMPHEILLPGLRPKVPQGKAVAPEIKEAAEKLADIIEKLPKSLSSDNYFDMIAQQCSDSDEASGALAKALGFDDHSGWSASDAEREMAGEKLKELVKQAADYADSSNSWGSVPMWMREEIRRMVSNEIDWRALVRMFCGRCQSSRWIRSMKRVNRRYPYIHPGARKARTARVAVFVDQSGSVSDADLSLFIGELDGLARQAQFTFMAFDTEVDETNAFVWKRRMKPTVNRTKCGGTDFNAPVRWLNKNIDRFDGAFILTDGYAPQPEESRVRTAWLITPSGELQFKPGSALVIKMKGPNKP